MLPWRFLVVWIKVKWIIEKKKCNIFYDPEQKPVSLNSAYRSTLNIYTEGCNCCIVLITKNWKQPKCLSLRDWWHKLWSVQIIEYFVAIKKNDVDLGLLTGEDFQDIYQEVEEMRLVEYCICRMILFFLKMLYFMYKKSAMHTI